MLILCCQVSGLVFQFIIQFSNQLNQQGFDDELGWDAVGKQLIHLTANLQRRGEDIGDVVYV